MVKRIIFLMFFLSCDFTCIKAALPTPTRRPSWGFNEAYKKMYNDSFNDDQKDDITEDGYRVYAVSNATGREIYAEIQWSHGEGIQRIKIAANSARFIVTPKGPLKDGKNVVSVAWIRFHVAPKDGKPPYIATDYYNVTTYYAGRSNETNYGTIVVDKWWVVEPDEKNPEKFIAKSQQLD